MQSSSRGSLKFDIASAYLLTAARIISWIIVAGMLYRNRHADYAMFALVRGTIGIVAYTGLGLLPAAISLFTRPVALVQVETTLSEPIPSAQSPTDTRATEQGSITLEYQQVPVPIPRPRVDLAIPYSNALAVATAAIFLGLIITGIYTAFAPQLHKLPTNFSAEQLQDLVESLGLAIVARVASEASGAVLQSSGQIALDNLIQTGAELAWAAGVLLIGRFVSAVDSSCMYAFSMGLLFSARVFCAGYLTGVWYPRAQSFDRRLIRYLVSFGVFVSIAQVADFLYAPTDFILINRLLNPIDIAIYAPAIQVDAALLLTVTALASVLLPQAAIAHGKSNPTTVRRYYTRGTLASVAIMLSGALLVLSIAPRLFRFWLHDPMPATRAILPLVLIHTVVGGSSAVGRSILLAVGKVRPFTFAVLIAGATNVIFSYLFVRYFHLGLPGIIYGTILAVIGRCGIWMPWYVMRTLRKGDVDPSRGVEVSTPLEMA